MSEQFIEYLDNLRDMCNLFENMTVATEIMSEIPLTEEQVAVANAYFEKFQSEWETGFLKLLEVGVTWIKKNKEKGD